MNVAELYDELPIELPGDAMDALASHHAKQVAGEFFLRLMNREEIIELYECLADLEEFQDILPLWSDDNSNYVGLYCRGPLQNKVCYISHEETDLSPGFRSVSSFLASLEQSPDLDWDELKKNYPTEADIDTQHLEDDRKCIDELNELLHSNQLNDDYRVQLLYSVMAVTPKTDLDSIVKYLDDEDMYVQERACEILGYHRHVPAKEKLREIAQSGMPNGRQAAKGALARIREAGETSKS
ncbi:HEAT repeat domain-containing protein [Paenibacillus thiaminolyticus]|uniref:HEAT repeat domain-containing protein n=1 Tax=Paenibacillus thiaminolyticus TaxID=49283 RepID=UPI003D28B44B